MGATMMLMFSSPLHAHRRQREYLGSEQWFWAVMQRALHANGHMLVILRMHGTLKFLVMYFVQLNLCMDQRTHDGLHVPCTYMAKCIATPQQPTQR